MNDSKTIELIIQYLGGKENIVSVMNCVTRLRVVVKKESPVREDELKGLENVMGIVHDRPKAYEIVVGPGKSRKYAEICHEKGLPDSSDEQSEWKKNKSEVESKQKHGRIKELLKIVGDIFIPLIPGIIAAGLCAGFSSLIVAFVPDYENQVFWHVLIIVLQLISQSLLTYLTAWTGFSAAKRFGATPILGGMLGMITSLSGIIEMARVFGLYNEELPLQSVLSTGKGGILAVICGVFILSVVEKNIRKIMHPSVDIFFTPLLTMLICMIPYVLLVMPAFGFVSNGIAWIFNITSMSPNIFVRIITGYCASACFLPLVACGMHHGMVALYTIQLQEFGYVTLFPVLAMAGAGQVGAAIAIYVKAKKLKHKKLCAILKGAIPAGFLGIGEPLIYGVTLPMGTPFITAGLGAGFGGAFVMAMQVGASAWGTSGLLTVITMTAGPNGPVMSMVYYLIGLLISYVMGFIITGFVIKEKTVAEAVGGIPDEDANSCICGSKIYSPVDGVSEEVGKDAALTKHHTVRHGDKIVFNQKENSKFTHVIKDPLGIHARPAGEIRKIVSDYDCNVTVTVGDKKASAESVIELMALGACHGDVLYILAEGGDAHKVCEILRKYMEENL